MTSHLTQPVPPDFTSRGPIKVEQVSYPIHGGGHPNGLGMGSGVIPPPALQDVVTHSVGPQAIVDTPMQEVPAQVENQIHPCISELLSSPHMLPCKILILLHARFMVQFSCDEDIHNAHKQLGHIPFFCVMLK